jgi:hypothetical protein
MGLFSTTIGDLIEDHGLRGSCAVELKINGSKFKSESWFVESFRTDLTVKNKAGVCTIKLKGVAFPDKDFDLNEDIKAVKVGAKVQLSGGFMVDGEPKVCEIFYGFIYGFEILLGGTIAATINAMDAKMWMMSERKIEGKMNKKKISEVVKGTLLPYSAKCSGQNVSLSRDPEFKMPFVQREETDFEFLCRLSDLSGCHFYIDQSGELYFNELKKNKSVKITIDSPSTVFNIKFSSNVLGIPKSIEVVAGDEADSSKAVVSTASFSSTIGSGELPSSLSSNIKGKLCFLGSAAETKQVNTSLAEAKFYKKSIFATVEVMLELMPEIELGKGVKVKNFGDPFDNSYVTVGVSHLYNYGINGARTILILGTDCYNPLTASLF